MARKTHRLLECFAFVSLLAPASTGLVPDPATTSTLAPWDPTAQHLASLAPTTTEDVEDEALDVAGDLTTLTTTAAPTPQPPLPTATPTLAPTTFEQSIVQSVTSSTTLVSTSTGVLSKITTTTAVGSVVATAVENLTSTTTEATPAPTSEPSSFLANAVDNLTSTTTGLFGIDGLVAPNTTTVTTSTVSTANMSFSIPPMNVPLSTVVTDAGELNTTGNWSDSEWFWDFLQDMSSDKPDAYLERSMGTIGFAIFTFISAVIYKMRVVNKIISVRDPLEYHDASEAWKRLNLFSCFSDLDTCCYVIWCWPMVAAKNYQATFVMPYWPSCCLLYVTYHCWCVGAVLRTYFTSRMKEHLNIHNYSACQDCLLSAFCMPCEIGRESMLVDEALGIHVGCPFKVEERRPIAQNELSSYMDSRSGYSSPPGMSMSSRNYN